MSWGMGSPPTPWVTRLPATGASSGRIRAGSSTSTAWSRCSWPTWAGATRYRSTSTGCVAGPAANLLVAIVFGVVVRVLLAIGAPPNPFTLAQPPLGLLSSVVYAIYFLNLSIFAFQLLPIPGLDGWRVLEALFRRRSPLFFYNVSANVQTIWIVCAVVIFFGPYLLHFGILDAVVGIFFQPAATGILGQCTGYVSLHPCPLSGRF